MLLERCDAVEADIGGKSLDVSKLVQSSIGIDSEDADDSDPGLEVEEILAIAADGDVKVTGSVGERAHNRVRNWRESSVCRDRKACDGRCSCVVDVDPFAIGSDHIPAVPVAEGAETLSNRCQRAV